MVISINKVKDDFKLYLLAILVPTYLYVLLVVLLKEVRIGHMVASKHGHVKIIRRVQGLRSQEDTVDTTDIGQDDYN